MSDSTDKDYEDYQALLGRLTAPTQPVEGAGAGRGFVNPPEDAPPPQTAIASAKKKAPTTAENQAAFVQALKDAKQHIMDLNFGDAEPRHADCAHRDHSHGHRASRSPSLARRQRGLHLAHGG